jgi:hypothetical protein
MSTCPFCNPDPEPTSGTGERGIGLFGRFWRGIQWLFPTTLLVLMPKCPICLAAYVALFTGIGISVSTARWIQISVPVLCLTMLAYLTYLTVRRWRFRLVNQTSVSKEQ